MKLPNTSGTQMEPSEAGLDLPPPPKRSTNVQLCSGYLHARRLLWLADPEEDIIQHR